MIYLDNGATTFPKPNSVIKAVNDAMTRYGANPGRSGHKLSMIASEKIYECRTNAATLFDVDSPEKVIFTNNCTTALNTVIKGILKKGDHAVISSLEHNAVVRPLEKMREHGVEYSVADYDKNDDVTLDNFRKAIRENTKLVICTHASNVFGVKLPIERISAMCKIYGILFCVDAAQTAGVVPISLKNSYIDYLCTAGHKGLYGPMGTGMLIINSKTTPNSFIQGGTGSQSSDAKQPSILPDKYESGTPNLLGIAGLNEGIKFVISKTPEKLFKSETELIKLLYLKLNKLKNVILYTDIPDENKFTPVLSFNIKNYESEKIGAILSNKYNIAVRSGLHCAPLAHKSFTTDATGTVRVVASAFTTMQHINYLINAIKEIN